MGRKRKERTHTLAAEEENRKKEQNRIDVSFSKRRKGLFGKAARLCKDFDDTQIAVLVVSIAGRPYAFGHSSVDEVLNDHCHIRPTTTKSVEGLNLMRQQHQRKKLMGVKEGIEKELRACHTVEGLALLREKYLKLDEEIKERLKICSSEEISFEGGVVDHNKYDIVNVGEGCSLGSGHGSSDYNFLWASSSTHNNCSLGLGHEASDNSLLASTTSNYGVDDGGGLRLNVSIDAEQVCSLGLGYEVGGNSLRDSSTDIRGNSLLASTTSNYDVDYGEGLRLNVGIDAEQGCSLGLGQEVGGNSLRDSTTEIKSVGFDVSALAWVCAYNSGDLDTVVSSSDFAQSNTNTNKGYYSSLMEEADDDSDLYSYQDLCNFQF
ncbi:hypothetical protein M0R45_016873 [Rubus argutus]|uniref:MADS-box domain-containing protein n=1 Tax=Rubus argutus TaxID=59490 RepID=A0AAW1XXE8_RUBAR